MTLRHAQLLALEGQGAEQTLSLLDRERAAGDCCGLTTQVGLVELLEGDALFHELVAPAAHLGLVGDRQEDEVARRIVPLPGHVGEGDCVLEGCMCRLGCLQAG